MSGEISFGDELVGRMKKIAEAFESGEPLETNFTIRRVEVAWSPKAYRPEDAKRIRDLLGVTQVVFARYLGVSPNAVRGWEQGTAKPGGMARRFFELIENDPAYHRQLAAPLAG